MTTETVSVTGAAGFIGRWVVHELLDRGYYVRGMDNLSKGSKENIAEFIGHDRFEFTVGDVTTEDDVADLITTDTTACFHLAAEIDVQESLEDPVAHFDANIIGTKNILEACRETETMLGLVGTCMVYDMADSADGISEEHPVKPASPYAGSKLAAEDLAESYYHGYDLPVTILRPFNTYGPYQRSDMAGGVVSIFTARDLRGETLKIFGDGTQTRDLLYATDCARFIVDGTFSESTTGEVLNAGTGVDVSINELAKTIATDGTEITHVEHHHPQSEVQRLRCDPTKAKEVLGWEPEVTLENGVGRVRSWMQETQ